MKLDELRNYCLEKKAATDDFPFDDVTMVIKVGDKMFALIAIDNDPLSINLKCDPLIAEGLREKYNSVTPGYHMNKKHWNTVIMDNTIPQKIIKGMIDDSYDLVLSKLSKKNRNTIIKR
ncbi:MAG: MmcQ/YjbR family DNA-binding protein [Candidatus Cloacimonetes bacterium]|nr:MmcQ/YjbR family DNA-binding protein [Candidatus Cloacimonadota bacterium]